VVYGLSMVVILTLKKRDMKYRVGFAVEKMKQRGLRCE
jgi:hypothetical protein